MLVVCALAQPARVAAHGAPAAVLGVVRSDVQGRPELLRLSEGLAMRAGERYRYVCPALFGSDETPRTAALPGGPTLVATVDQLHVLDDDGHVTPHPDPSASKTTVRALEATSDGAMMLRQSEQPGEVELLRLDAETARVVAQLPGDYGSLAAERDAVLVAGLTDDGRALQRGYAPDGRERSAWAGRSAAPPDAIAALARIAAGQPYVLVLAGDGPISELAQLDEGALYRVVQRASVALSGPVAGDAEHVWLAFDGRLGELRAGVVTVRETDAPVTCVLRAGEHAYACVGTDLLSLGEDGLGERVFGLDELQPPDVDALDPALAEHCTLQWLRFRVDLTAAGVELLDADVEDAGDRDGGAASDAGGRAQGDAGCSVRGAIGAERDSTGGLTLLAPWVWSATRKRRRGNS